MKTDLERTSLTCIISVNPRVKYFLSLRTAGQFTVCVTRVCMWRSAELECGSAWARLVRLLQRKSSDGADSKEKLCEGNHENRYSRYQEPGMLQTHSQPPTPSQTTESPSKHLLQKRDTRRYRDAGAGTASQSERRPHVPTLGRQHFVALRGRSVRQEGNSECAGK